MIDENDSDEVGYCKPPKHTRFVKGRSGNPKGRPKGSKNFATILEKAGRERIRVTENGRDRSITKFEACALQLMNKGASGDLKAIRQVVGQAEAVQTCRDPLEALVAEMRKESERIGPPRIRRDSIPKAPKKAQRDLIQMMRREADCFEETLATGQTQMRSHAVSGAALPIGNSDQTPPSELEA